MFYSGFDALFSILFPLVFLFVLQLTPAFRARTNWLQFLIIGVLTVVEYIFFVSKTLNTLFATLIIFVCFAITTDYLRKYFIKKLENCYLAINLNHFVYFNVF